MNAVQRLEDWRAGHKARSVDISVDNGYGASCWSVSLYHEHGRTTAEEVAFFGSKLGWEQTVRDAEAAGVVFAQKDEDFDDWPGLEATIHAAVDAFVRGIWIAT